jgi:predicted RNase H-like HicB family nuclease
MERLTMQYPIVIHKDKASDYGVTVPDLPGCFSAGATMDEAMAMAKEAIELHLEAMIDEGLPIPDPATIEQHQRKRDYRGGTWALVSIEDSRLRINAKRIQITMPERVLDAVDRFAQQHGMSRSGLLTKAASKYIGRGEKVPNVRRGRPSKRRSTKR